MLLAAFKLTAGEEQERQANKTKIIMNMVQDGLAMAEEEVFYSKCKMSQWVRAWLPP